MKHIFEISDTTPRRKEFIAFLLKQGHEVDWQNRRCKFSRVDGDKIVLDLTAQRIWLEMWDGFIKEGL